MALSLALSNDHAGVVYGQSCLQCDVAHSTRSSYPIDYIAPLSRCRNATVQRLSRSHSDHLKFAFQFVRFILAIKQRTTSD